jgi:hypothetical protein
LAGGYKGPGRRQAGHWQRLISPCAAYRIREQPVALAPFPHRNSTPLSPNALLPAPLRPPHQVELLSRVMRRFNSDGEVEEDAAALGDAVIRVGGRPSGRPDWLLLIGLLLVIERTLILPMPRCTLGRRVRTVQSNRQRTREVTWTMVTSTPPTPPRSSALRGPVPGRRPLPRPSRRPACSPSLTHPSCTCCTPTSCWRCGGTAPRPARSCSWRPSTDPP